MSTPGEPSERLVVLVALTGMFSTTFPGTILVVALPTIADEFQVSTAALAWVVSLPMIASAIMLPILGKLGDIVGHRRVFLVGFFIAGVVALFTASSTTPAGLVAWRTLAQVAGAATMPASMALVLSVTSPADRARRVGLWGMVTAAAPAAGLSIGGPVIEMFGWQWIFVIQGTFCALAALLVLLVLRGLPDVRRPQRLDLGGALLLATSTGSGLIVISRIPATGLLDTTAIGMAVLAVLSGVTFVWVEKRVDNPLVPLDLARARNFRVGVVVATLVGASYMGTFVLAPLALTGSFGLSVAMASWLTLIRTASLSLGGPVGGRLVGWRGERSSAVTSALILAAGSALLGVSLFIGQLWMFVVASVLCGIGHGASRPPVASLLVHAAGEENLGFASATERMMFQVGASFGITMLAAVYGGSGSSVSLGLACLVGAAIALGAAIASWWFQNPRLHRRCALPVGIDDRKGSAA